MSGKEVRRKDYYAEPVLDYCVIDAAADAVAELHLEFVIPDGEAAFPQSDRKGFCQLVAITTSVGDEHVLRLSIRSPSRWFIALTDLIKELIGLPGPPT